jgi:hypothetical protein
MLSKLGIVILVSVALSTAGGLDRIHKVFHDLQVNLVHPAKSCKSCLNLAPQSEALPIEVFQVYDLPLNVHEASLTKTERGYFLKLSLGNSSDLRMIGLRYSLALIDSRNQLQSLINRSEGFSVPAYGTKTLTFKTPIKLKPKRGERLLLMVEQVISRESIWEVVKAKEALEAYARGDFSVVPTVLRVANQVDAPPGIRRIYFRRN